MTMLDIMLQVTVRLNLYIVILTGVFFYGNRAKRQELTS